MKCRHSAIFGRPQITNNLILNVGIHERGYPGFSVGAGESRENPRADSVKAVGSEGERERPNVETVLSCKDIPKQRP